MTKYSHKYSTYELFDFLLDPDFKQWILQPTDKLDEFWQTVISDHPTQYDNIQQAIKIVKNLPSADQNLLADRKEILWGKIQQNLESHRPKQVHRRLSILKYAVALFLILGAASGIWIYQQTSSGMQIATGNGENKCIALPDGSEVLLAPHFSISYPKDFLENDKREIWAKGDAKLNVKHLNQNSR